MSQPLSTGACGSGNPSVSAKRRRLLGIFWKSGYRPRARLRERILTCSLAFAALILDQGRSDAQLQQVGKLDLLRLGRHQRVLACSFNETSVTVLIRRSNAESKQVAFSLCEFGRDGQVQSDKVVHRWDPEQGGAMNFAFALMTDHGTTQAKDVGTLVLGPLTRDETGVIQRYSSAGKLQWTEPLPGGGFSYCLDIKPSPSGFVTAGVAGNPSAATLRGLDWNGRESWKWSGKKRHQASLILVNSKGEIVAFTVPIDSASDDLSMLTLISAEGQSLKERPLAEFGKIIDHRVNALYLGALDFAWLAGPMKNESIVFAYANKPFATGTPAQLHLESYNPGLERTERIDLGPAFADWTYFFNVSKLDRERLLISGVGGEKFRCAVTTLTGEIQHMLQIPPPEHTIAANVWTDGAGRVAIFLECMEQTDTGAVVRAGILYLLQDKKP